MICARRVALNSSQLDQVDNAVVIRSIETADGKENFSAVSLAGGCGQRITNHHRDTLDVIVRFAIRIKKNDLAGRAAVLEAVNSWAARAAESAWLTVNYKTNRRMRVTLVQAPGEGSLWDFNKDFQITFRAYGVPYWQETTASSTAEITTAATSGDASMSVGGNADTVADVTLTNGSSSTVDVCSVTVDGNTMSFSDLGLAASESLVIDHTADGVLRIRILDSEEEYRSVMSKRTPASVDDLWCRKGTRFVSFEADHNCTLEASCKGRYL